MDKVLKKLTQAFFFKVHGGPFQRVGIPDIVGCYHGRFVAIEVKRPGEQPTARQMATLVKLRAAGAYVMVATDEEQVREFIARIDRELAA